MAYPVDSSEPIALVGSACRFAGSITSPSQLWEVASRLPDLSQPVPISRFHVDGFFHKNPEHHGTTSSTNGYFLGQDHRHFDAAFFNITPKEAEAIDPQQRLLLEVAFEALESAGYTMQQYAGQSVGVFAGTMTGDFDILSTRDDLNASQYAATGNARSILSNRISYIFDFRGPSLTIDTACSSSLVALHQAIQSLRSGESPMACVAGVNMILAPEQFIAESNLHMLSPTGHCRMWDAKADGYARGEGIAALFIKPLSRALADGDHIQAIIRETGVSSDGKTQGITRPSAAAQTALIQNTYSKAGLDTKNPDHQPQFFEAHGTGTPVGDPLEARAISEAFFDDSLDNGLVEKRMLVGSIKTIIGHTEGAAGLAGVLKVVQSMNKGLLIQNLHLESISSEIVPFCNNLHIVTNHTPWPEPAPGHPRRGSVNSFGFGGTNAHAIIEQYEPSIHNPVARRCNPQLPKRICWSPELPIGPAAFSSLDISLPLVVSAASPKSLHLSLVKFNNLLQRKDYKELVILAWQLYNHQTSHTFRKVFMAGLDNASDTQSFISPNAASISSPPSGAPKGMIRAQLQRGSSPKILGIFTGQGAQYAAMSKGLFSLSSVYRDTIKTLDEVLQTCSDPPAWTIQEELMKNKEASLVDLAEVSQVTCCALQIGLVDFLQSLGIAFACVVGHSSGEITAAYAAGRITARDAILISYCRGKYSYLAAGTGGAGGAMAACGMSKLQAEAFCSLPEFKGKISVAANNSPTLVTLSGDLDALEKAMEILKEEGVFFRRLLVDKAYHSFHMRHVVEAYNKALEQFNIQSLLATNGSQWVSTVSGRTIDARDSFDIAHWGYNVLRPVLFHEAVVTAMKDWGPFDCVIEVGSHPALKSALTDIFKSNNESLIYTGILDRGKGDRFAVANFLGFMVAHFGPSSVNIRSYILNSPNPEVAASRFPVDDLPTYSWDHSQIHWRESRISTQYHFRTHPPHELLGVRTRDDNEYSMRWRNILKIEDIPWLVGHKFQGQVLLPASAYCAMAFDAAGVLLGSRAKSAVVVELLDVDFLSGVTFEPHSLGVEILFCLSIPDMVAPTGQEGEVVTATFTMTSVPLKSHGTSGNAMTRNFQGKMRIVFLAPLSPMPRRSSGARAETLPVKVDAFYQMMDGIGLNYTGPFRGLKSLDRRLNYAKASLDTYHPHDTTELSVSPALLDSCFQATFATFSSPGDNALWTSFLPASIQMIRLYKPDSSDPKNRIDRTSETVVEAHLTSFQPYTKATTAKITADLSICKSKETWIEVEGLKVTSFAPTKAEDDYELYLHTIMNVDPEQEIVSCEPLNNSATVEIIESCERVARHFARETKTADAVAVASPPQSPKLSDIVGSDWELIEVDTNLDEMTRFMRRSRIFNTLQFIRLTCQTNPGSLPAVLNMAVGEAQLLLHFQEYLSRVVQQIAHRYPRMNILGLTDPRLSVAEAILGGLQDCFRSYTFAQGVEPNLRSRMPNADFSRVSISFLDLEDCTDAQAPSNGLYDMVILSTSVLKKAQKPGWNPVPVLEKIRSISKEGAFFILIIVTQGANEAEVLVTPPDWMDWLEQSGFSSGPRNADLGFPLGLSMHIRQTRSYHKEMMRYPSTWSSQQTITRDLLIIGGTKPYGIVVSKQLEECLRKHCVSVDRAESLGAVSLDQAAKCTAIILLEYLEEPIATNLDAEQLATLKRIMRSGIVILWVTRTATDGPERAAALGLTRTLKAETPGLVLQVLDLMGMEIRTHTIFETFCRLAYSKSFKQDAKAAVLWSNEGEIHVEDGIRLIPRIVPYKHANERLNAYRRPVSHKVDSGRNSVVLQGLSNGDGSSRDGWIRFVPTSQEPLSPELSVRLRVNYSSTWAMRVGTHGSGTTYLCVGRNMESGRLTVGLSKYQASIVRIRPAYTLDLSAIAILDVHTETFAATLAKVLLMHELMITTETNHLVVINPDMTLVRCFAEVFSGTARCKVHFWTTDRKLVKAHSLLDYIYPWISISELKRILPNDFSVRAFLPKTSQLWKSLVSVCPAVEIGYGSPVANDTTTLVEEPFGTETCKPTVDALALAVNTSVRIMRQPDADATMPSCVSTNFLTNKKPAEGMPPFAMISWEENREITLPVAPHVQDKALRPNCTYLLVGMTRDFGQSICRLFIQQGARFIIVASRKPDVNAEWIAELNRQGAKVLVATLDVTNIESVKRFKAQLSPQNIKTPAVPPLGGIVNGAMVLEDGVFANMDMASWQRVMGPKVDGSRNLDLVFGEEKLDFFILTSSFAAIGGHAGQSAYATANMFMNGLAAYRLARGKAGSVLNIGVIHGLGLLTRDSRQSVYDALERDGYPPISERDLHHMFLEAIEGGRPNYGPRRLTDLTTGLSRRRENEPHVQHWHLDERFSHLIKYEAKDANTVVSDGEAKTSIIDRVKSADSAQKIAGIISVGLCARMEVILQRPVGSVRGDNSIVALGVDSLAAVEVRNWFYKTVGQNVAVMRIMGSSSIEKLCDEVAQQIVEART